MRIPTINHGPLYVVSTMNKSSKGFIDWLHSAVSHESSSHEQGCSHLVDIDIHIYNLGSNTQNMYRYKHHLSSRLNEKWGKLRCGQAHLHSL
jgi:hypothetical protein